MRTRRIRNRALREAAATVGQTRPSVIKELLYEEAMLLGLKGDSHNTRCMCMFLLYQLSAYLQVSGMGSLRLYSCKHLLAAFWRGTANTTMAIAVGLAASATPLKFACTGIGEFACTGNWRLPFSARCVPTTSQAPISGESAYAARRTHCLPLLHQL